jgi:hypothetical protein
MCFNLVKRTLFSIEGFLFSIFIIIGCSSFSKEDYLVDFSSFISEIEANYKVYTDENWETKESEYQKYAGEYYEKVKMKLTDEDIHLIGKLKGKYQATKLKYETEKLVNKASEIFKQLEGVVEGFSESISNQ